MAARVARNPAGSAVKPRTSASGENGSATPMATHTNVATVSGRLGRLRKNGTRRVEERADRPEEQHEAADERGVPVRGTLELLLVDVVGRDGHLAGEDATTF